ncbi:MAG: 50S ribosomal protein L18 [Alphaproteobacteria bacterium GM7ARS4]|nr:50S ribosomal protein L18 [Alphaproteobacteria bacterium GM7ARS4]
MSKERLVSRRARRQRYRLRQGKNSVRLSVFRSHQHMYAQIIDDRKRTTLVSASTLDKELGKTLKTGGTIQSAQKVGELIAQRATSKNITHVVFDRGGYAYHGRVRALAESAREGGLSF